MFLFHPICHLDSITGGKIQASSVQHVHVASTFTFRDVSRMEILGVSASWTEFALKLPFFVLVRSHQAAFTAKTRQRIKGSHRAFD